MPKGVPVAKSLKFFELDRVYQSMTTMNNGQTKINVILPLADEPEDLKISGGMTHVTSGTWKSVKGLAIPEGAKIEVWKEETNVRAFSLVPAWRWKFPKGTVAYDLLFRTRGSDDDVLFEARLQTKSDDGWEDGEVYRPDPNGKEWKIARSGSPVHPDAPPGYKGAVKSCFNCHTQTGQLVEVRGRTYLTKMWGDDGRFAWRPFDNNGDLDERWPIVLK